MDTAELAAVTGMTRAADSAERKHGGWMQEAIRHLRQYAATRGGFLIEDARSYAEMNGLTAPPDDRAWGAVARVAKASGVIAPAGYAKAKSSNNSPKVLWVAAAGA